METLIRWWTMKYTVLKHACVSFTVKGLSNRVQRAPFPSSNAIIVCSIPYWKRYSSCVLLVTHIFDCSVLNENKRNRFFSSTVFEDTAVRIISLVGRVKKRFFDFAFRRLSLMRPLWENIFPGWSRATTRRNGLRFIR